MRPDEEPAGRAARRSWHDDGTASAAAAAASEEDSLATAARNVTSWKSVDIVITGFVGGGKGARATEGIEQIIVVVDLLLFLRFFLRIFRQCHRCRTRRSTSSHGLRA